MTVNTQEAPRVARARWLRRLVILAAVAGLVLAVVVLLLMSRRAGEGTLDVQLADESLEVVIAGVGVVRRQNGSGEVVLPAGRYEVWCGSEGRAGRSLWVDVPAGGEVEAHPASPLLASAAKPFVILPTDDEPALMFDSLARALEVVRAGETIEVHGNGPFLVDPLKLDRDVVIRAASGFRPVLRLAPAAQGALLHTKARLVLEGLELDARPAKPGPPDSRAALAGDGSLYLAFCRLRQEGDNLAIRTSGKIVQLVNSVVYGGNWSGMRWTPPEGGRLHLHGLLINGMCLDLPRPPHDSAVEIDHCTFTGYGYCIEVRYQRVPPEGEPPLRIGSRESAFAASVMLLVNRYGPEKIGAPEATASLGRLVAWKEEGNIYPDGRLLRHAVWFAPVPMQPEVRTLADWGRAWGRTKVKARQGKIRFAGKNLHDKVGGPSVDAFRLAQDSAGKGRDGRDAGIDVTQLGPGPAYDRWRKTPEYQAWQGQSVQAPRLADESRDRLAALIEKFPDDDLLLLAEQADQLKNLLAKTPPEQADLLLLAARRLFERVGALRGQQGKGKQAEMAEQLARNCYERLLALRPDDSAAAAGLAGLLMPGVETTSWAVLRPVKMTSEERATLTPQSDGSILVSGKNPDWDTYTIEAQTDLKSITALRLEVLPHPNLPENGSGRSPQNGNFNLSEVLVGAAPRDGKAKMEDVSLGDAWSDYPLSQQAIKNVIDGDQTTFWDTWPRHKQPHTAIFVPRKPIGHKGGTTLTIHLDCLAPVRKQHTLGCFRLSVTTQPYPLSGERWRQGLAADEVSGRTWLAAAHYLRGEGKTALKILQKVAPVPARRSAIGAFLLALVHQQLGARKEALAEHTRGIAAMKAEPASSERPGEVLNMVAQESMQRVGDLSEAKASALLATLNRQREEMTLSTAIKRDPANVQTWYKRGSWYAMHGRWKEAAADLTRAVRLAPKDHWIGFQASTLLAQVGDKDTYREQCRKMLRNFAGTREAHVAERTIKAALLLPPTAEDLERCATLAAVAWEEGTPPEIRPFAETTMALLWYREGEFVDATTLARTAAGKAPEDWRVVVPAQIVLAMSLHRLGKTEEAKKQLALAVRSFKRQVPTVDRSGNSWHDWIICRILLREAEGILGEPADKAEE
jgi:tetratricopeptide (TPR) repeat protein